MVYVKYLPHGSGQQIKPSVPSDEQLWHEWLSRKNIKSLSSKILLKSNIIQTSAQTIIGSLVEFS